MIIAIDGPAGSGKSSTAKKVASDLGFLHLDTGAMYRAITLKCLRENIDYKDNDSLKKCVDNTTLSFEKVDGEMHMFLDGVDVAKEIRTDEVTKNVSDYCAPLVVREALVEQQRQIGSGQDTVCEGRDMGTVVFPKAELKFYMVASVEARAERRVKDFAKIGETKSIAELITDIEERDRKDSSRANSPLYQAEDAILLDTTDLQFDEQVAFIVNKANDMREA